MFWSEQLIILLQSIVNAIQQVLCQEVPVEKQISDQELDRLLDNKAGESQCHFGRRFTISQSTINRNLKNRTSIRIDKRRSPPKYNNENQQQRAKSNCTKTFSRLPTDLGRRKRVFALTGNVPGNSRYNSSDHPSAPTNTKFKRKQKYEAHLLVYLPIPS